MLVFSLLLLGEWVRLEFLFPDVKFNMDVHNRQIFKGVTFSKPPCVVFFMLNFLGVCGMNCENYFIEEQKMSQVSEEDIELHEVFGKKKSRTCLKTV